MKYLGVIILFFGTFTALAQPVDLYSPLYFTYSNLIGWRMLESQIENPKYNPITIHWTGHGGRSDLGQDFVNKILKAERRGKTIIFKVESFAYSEHAYVLCEVSNVKLGSAEVMWHAGTINGRYVTDSATEEDEAHILNMCIDKHYLTKQDEYNIIYKHKAVWLQNNYKWTTADVPRH